MRPTCALLLTALAGVACHTVKPVTLDELNAIRPERAWLTQSDQSVVIISDPQVVGDTVVGYINGAYEELPSTLVKQIQVERPATSRTVLLVSAIAVGFGGMAYALTGGGPEGGKDPSYCEEHEEDPACMM
jgi:hypothetical protein